jgi:hypothetical protein
LIAAGRLNRFRAFRGPASETRTSGL